MGVVTVEAGGQPSEVFKLIETSLNTVALFVEIFAILMWTPGVGFGRDDDLHAAALHMAPEVLADISLVCDQRLGLDAAYQRLRLCDVGGFAAGELRPHRQAIFIGREMDFGGQSSAGSPHSLIAAPPFPALDC